MKKAPDAFRTISEVSEWLDTPAHVLRFWESKFSQIKPVKRAGGRRYYRPDDMRLLGGIKKMLHIDGLTIKGAQKVLREKGVKHVVALSPDVTEPVAGQKSDVDVMTDQITKPVADVASAPPAPLMLDPANMAPTEPAPVATPVAAEPIPAAAAFFAPDQKKPDDRVGTTAADGTTKAPADRAQDMTNIAAPLDAAPSEVGESQPAIDSAAPASAKTEDISELYGRLKSLRRRMKDAQ